jgi:hypothetical protein
LSLQEPDEVPPIRNISRLLGFLFLLVFLQALERGLGDYEKE